MNEAIVTSLEDRRIMHQWTVENFAKQKVSHKRIIFLEMLEQFIELLTFEQFKEEGLLEATQTLKKDSNEKVKIIFLDRIFP